jgi:hypothetical protein
VRVKGSARGPAEQARKVSAAAAAAGGGGMKRRREEEGEAAAAASLAGVAGAILNF